MGKENNKKNIGIEAFMRELVIESLRDWFQKEDWVRITTAGNIAGPCGTSKNDKNPDRCLPRKKAKSLTKSERAATAKKKKKAGSKGKTVVKNTKKATVQNETADSQDGKAAPYGSGFKKITKEDIKNLVTGTVNELKNQNALEEDKDDRCTRIAKRKYETWPCVPLHSEALTRTGWKTYNQLSIGEEILAFDIQSGTLKYTPIEHLHFYKNADITKLEKQNHLIEATPNHRWLTYSTANRDEELYSEGYNKAVFIYECIREYERSGNINKSINNFKTHIYPMYKDCTIWEIFDVIKPPEGSLRFKTTEDLKSGDLIKSAAPLDDSYSGIDTSPFRKYDQHNNLHKVLNFSRKQAEAYLYSAIMYDGWDNTNDSRYRDCSTYNKFALKQKDSTHSDMFEIASIYSGYNATRGRDSSGMRSCYVEENDYISCNVLKKAQGDSQDVWCPTTQYGTWVMRQHGRAMITGNSAYASGAVVRCRRGEIWKDLKEDLTESKATCCGRCGRVHIPKSKGGHGCKKPYISKESSKHCKNK